MARRKAPAAAEVAHIVEPLRRLAIRLDDLVEDPRNARYHSERNLAAIRASMQRFGQRSPVVAQRRDDGSLVVRAGNGRIVVARELDWSHVACVVVDEDDTTATAFGLADNRTGELASWDFEGLGTLLQELAEAGEDLVVLGWDQDFGDLDTFEEPEPTRIEPPDINVEVITEATIIGGADLANDAGFKADLDELCATHAARYTMRVRA